MRVLYSFILITVTSCVCLTSNAQIDSTSKLIRIDSAVRVKNGETLLLDTVQMPPLHSTKVNNGKEILLDTLKPQKDSAAIQLAKKDSVSRKQHDPRKATLRSAIIPGWGQAYNREYWKIPIVYGALSIPAVTFVYNNNWYQRTKQAYSILVNHGDTNSVNPKLKGLSSESLQYYRNSFRKDRDYSVVFFLLAWALNVADATVFGHLKNFDVSTDLSMHIQPDYDINTKSPSLGLVLNYKSKQKKLLSTSF